MLQMPPRPVCWCWYGRQRQRQRHSKGSWGLRGVGMMVEECFSYDVGVGMMVEIGVLDL